MRRVTLLGCLICVLFLGQAFATNGTVVIDTQLEVTPEYRSEISNSTQEIKLWITPYESIK